MIIDPTVKKYLKYGLIGIAGLLMVWLIYTFLTTASVQIITNDQKNIVSIQQTAPQQKSIDIGNVTGNFSTRLATGSYIVTVKNDYASAQQIFTLGIGDSKKVTVNVDTQANTPGVLEPVSDLGAYDVVADKSSVKFIDRNKSPTFLYSIDSNNALTIVAPNTSYDTIAWANSSYGVGRIGSQLQTIQGSTIADLKTPVAADKATFAVAPNHDVYLSDGSGLYRQSDGQNFTKVMTADSQSQIKIVSASSNSVLLTEKSTDTNREGELTVLHKNDTKNTTNGELYEGAWSKSGKYLAVSGDTSAIFDSNLKKIVNLPINNVNNLVWMSDNDLVYAQSNLLWKFSLDTRRATVLATTNSGVGSISQIALSDDGSSLYVSIQNADSTNGYTFYLTRYKFNTKVVISPLLQKLGLALPNSPIDGCYDGYANFNQPTVTVTAIASIEQLCLDATKTYLQGYGVNTDPLKFQFVNAESL